MASRAISPQISIILLQQFEKKLCLDVRDKIPVQKGREEGCEATLCKAGLCVDCYKQEGFNLFTLSS